MKQHTSTDNWGFKPNYKPTFSVIICAYTEARWNDLVAAIDSVQNQTLVPQEIIVVIDHNLSLLARTRTEIEGVKVIENREARGLSGARNSGIALAHSQVVAFIDDDAIAAPDWLEQLSCFYADVQVAGIGGTIEPLWATGRPGWFPQEFNWVVGCTYRGMTKETAPVRNLIGCNMSFRREIFSEIGGFRSGIGRVGKRPLGCEETELCIRLNKHCPDQFILFDPKARVQHRVPSSRGSLSYFRARCYAEGLSKALVTQLVGQGAGLASERKYTFLTLPMGVLDGILAALNGDLNGLGRAFAIVAGLLITTWGYLVGKLALKRKPQGVTNLETKLVPIASNSKLEKDYWEAEYAS